MMSKESSERAVKEWVKEEERIKEGIKEEEEWMLRSAVADDEKSFVYLFFFDRWK